MKKTFCDLCTHEVEAGHPPVITIEPRPGRKIGIRVKVDIGTNSERTSERSVDLCWACRRRLVNQAYPP